MTTWIDTNVLSAMYSGKLEERAKARAAMKEAEKEGWFAISGCVFAELLARPGMTWELLVEFLDETKIPVSWHTGEDVWRLAAQRFSEYAERRRAQHGMPKRFLADFLIGAQATVRGGRLLSFDQRLFKAAFPELVLFGEPFEDADY